MKKYGFIVFLKRHMLEAWLLYVLLFIAVVCLTISSSCRIVEGLALSFIAAYIFFSVNDLSVRYQKERKGLLVSHTQFVHMVNNIQKSIDIIELFPKINDKCVCVPSNTQYFKCDDSKNFFCPKLEIKGNLDKAKKYINEIKEQNMQLPVDLLRDLNLISIQVDELQNYLKRAEEYANKNVEYEVVFTPSYEEIKDELEQLCKKIGKYFVLFKRKRWILMNEEEKNEYIKQNREILKTIPKQELIGKRIYKGTTRIG